MYDQLGLFENGEFVSGINFLNDLKLEKGLQVLEKADPLQEEDILLLEVAKEIGAFWKDMLTQFSRDEGASGAWKYFFAHYKTSEFPDRLNGMKKNIFRCLIEKVMEEREFDYDSIIQLFFLSNNEKWYALSEKLITAFVEYDPKNFKIYYLLAQAEWNNGHRGRAKKHYVQAFLYYPDRLMMYYVESPEFKHLADKYPLELLAAYGWVEGIMPFIPIEEDISYFSESHKIACEAYRLLQACNASISDKKKTLEYRKALKKIAPELLERYLKR